MDCPHKGPVTQKKLPFDDIIMKFSMKGLDQVWRKTDKKEIRYRPEIWRHDGQHHGADHCFTYSGRDKVGGILQATFSNTFSLHDFFF